MEGTSQTSFRVQMKCNIYEIFFIIIENFKHYLQFIKFFRLCYDFILFQFLSVYFLDLEASNKSKIFNIKFQGYDLK